MGKKEAKWSWSSALIGAAAATVATTIIQARPKAPKFRLVSLTALQVKLTGSTKEQQIKVIGSTKEKAGAIFPRVDADLILTIHVSNPNILPVRYSATSLSIFYEGSLLGSAKVPAGSTPPKSCQLLRLPARLNGPELAQHARRFIEDVSKRKMILNAEVDISGSAKAILWDPRFKVHVDSRIVVDPVLLDVIDQENETRLQMFVK